MTEHRACCGPQNVLMLQEENGTWTVKVRFVGQVSRLVGGFGTEDEARSAATQNAEAYGVPVVWQGC